MTGPEQLDVLWVTAMLGCDGDTVAMTAASQPSIEDLIGGLIPGVPRLRLHNPVLSRENGSEFMEWFERGARGELDPFILVVEGSVPNEKNKTDGYWAGFGNDPATGQPILTTHWIDRLAPHAWAVVAVGTCATYGGVHAMAGNPTDCMGLPDYLGWDWKSKSGIPVVCIPGCPVQPDTCTQTLLYLLRQAAGKAPPISLDSALRPTFIFHETVHEGCDRGGYYEQADFAAEYGSRRCIVKIGCWGPVVVCPVPKRGWMMGIGGCPNVGGICIGCTMPGFPDKFMPFMNEPPGAAMSTSAVLMYGRTVRALRNFTKGSLEQEPTGRAPSGGHQPQNTNFGIP